MSEKATTAFERGPETSDVQVRFTLLSLSEGGRSKPAIRRYSPHFAIRSRYLTSGRLVDLQPDPLAPGETGTAEVRFLEPEAYPGTLWLGRELSVQEGERPVGTATVLAVHNPLLLAERLPSEWGPEPPELTTVEAALRALVADRPNVRAAALEYLARAGEGWMLDAHVEDPDPEVRALALAGLGR
jgi:hypothetical protein